MTWFGAVLAVAVLVLADVLYVVWYFRWEARQTSGMAYFGRPLAERRALKRRIRWLSFPARPLLVFVAIVFRRQLTMPFFEFEGVAGPRKASGPEIFERAKHYRPKPEDVFVATQMRCGTTWMQQIVYEIVHRGQGDPQQRGHGHLYAISPWIDATNSVSMADAPVVGERPTRLIKTHLPTRLCPYSAEARYIYVARHPVGCFASIVDFNRSMAGPMAPPIEVQRAWYCSDHMYWLPWPAHVDGWWRWSAERDNVLFVHFEEMKRDLGAVVDRVAGFLGCALTPEARARIVDRSRFEYMRDHEEFFEMAPPTMYSVSGGKFMASGKEKRHEDVTPDVRGKILEYCRQALTGSAYPIERFYPDVAPAAGAAANRVE
ncbi:MAG TPA: sulfotransferase domain-containing protein [Vicinamibacterales bacterium]|nr:sulfotransferase domain-containing protein [Vicinamibacterales bacterium]